MSSLIEVLEDIDKALMKLEAEGRLTDKPGFYLGGSAKGNRELWEGGFVGL